MRAALIASVAFFVSACCWKQGHDITRPIVIEKDRLVLQPVPSDLLREHPVSYGPLSECPRVAADRREQLDACNADKAGIRAMMEKTK